MKRLLMLVTFSITVVCVCTADTVYTVNITGYARKELPPCGTYVLAGFNFSKNGGNSTLKDMLGTNQLRSASANPEDADRVMTYNTVTDTYQAYALKDSDMEFYPCNTVQEWNLASATNPVVPIGTSFWIVSAATSLTTNIVYIYGDVVDDESRNISLEEGIQMLAGPFSADQPIADINTSNLTSSVFLDNTDRISVWENYDHYQDYGLYTNGCWYPCCTTQEWNNATSETSRVILVGEGYWLNMQSPANVTEQNPYYGNIQ